MNPEWYLSNRIIILYYRRYSCGNFLANILSFNNNFIPKFVLDPFTPRYNPRVVELCQLPWSVEAEQECNKLKFQLLNTTIPTDPSDSVHWKKYELGCQEFWGWSVDEFDKVSQITLHNECGYFLNNNKYCFITAHTEKQYNDVKNVFINAKTIELVNDKKSNYVSTVIKNIDARYSHPPTLVDSIKFDIDSQFNQTDFFKNIDQLLDQLTVDNKELDSRVYDYYNQYTKLHTIT